MSIRIASTAYSLPPEVEEVGTILERERERVEAALAPLSAAMRKRALEGLGIERVHVCRANRPYPLALEAAGAALAGAGIAAPDVDLVIDFTTLPGWDGQFLSFAQKLSADLGIEISTNLSFRVGGCGGLHLALKVAKSLMESDEDLRTALLVAADAAPPGNRSLLPITVQSDGASAVILRRDAGEGPVLLGTEVATLAHLHDAIRVSGAGIDVDAARIENELMPVYYLNFLRLMQKALKRAGIELAGVDHVVYSNISRGDREGFLKAMRIPAEKAFSVGVAGHGHTFASDLVINYTELRRTGRLRTGDTLLFASAGIGFTWGVTLAR